MAQQIEVVESTMIRACTLQDAESLCSLYNPYVDETAISFEEHRLSIETMVRRIEEVMAHHPWLVYEEDGAVLGYAYASPWRARAAYLHSVESTVYLDRGATGRGVGSALYAALIEQLRAGGQHVVVGVIALPNEASEALHAKMGFERVGVLPEIGRKFDRWVDVAYWSLDLSRPIDTPG